MKLYGYCVTTAQARKPEALSGLSNQKVFVVQTDELTAFVSRSIKEPVVVSKQSVLIHQRVIASILEHTTPLPFRFGTVVTEQQLTSYLSSRQHDLLEKLAAVSGCVEMGIKIIRQKSAESATPEAPAIDNEKTVGVGTAFLLSKSKQMVGSEQDTEEGKKIRVWLEKLVRPHVRDMLVGLNPTERLVLTVDCLVERSQLDAYRTATEKAKSERPDLHFLTSGPWAPYSFANIELEFKTHFGVS